MSTEIDAEIVATCEAAATYLGEHGLARRSFMTNEGTACTTGALMLGYYGHGSRYLFDNVSIVRALRDCPAIPAVAEVVRARHGARVHLAAEVAGYAVTPQQVIYAFNDHPRTTPGEVIDVLRETIKRHTPDAYTSTPEEQP